jgi:glycosyltransferase involved in cell wall biosynthesis
MERKIHVAHLSSAHPRYDIRIFLKMCRSLVANDFGATFVVADGKGDEIKDGVQILDAGASRGRAARMIHAPHRVLARAMALDADIYQLHDPELLPIALKLKRLGRRVIFDSHEDFPASILSKPYIHPVVRGAIAVASAIYEKRVVSRLDHVIAATPAIRDKFLAIGARSTDINNYPLTEELASNAGWEERVPEVSYVGGVTRIRGLAEVVEAMSLTRSGARLNLVGPFSDQVLRQEVLTKPGWADVNEMGSLGRESVRGVLARSMAGLVTFLPEPNHVNAQPNKMFEYMSAEVPVIASHFPLWREIIEGADCGLCVDPEDPAEIALAIDRLVNHPDEARRMGENGRRAVLDRYNWPAEERKLIRLYRDMIGSGALVPD